MFYFRVFANLKLFCRYGSRIGLDFRPTGGAHRPSTSRVASCPSSYGGCRRDCVGGDPHADTSGGLEARPTLDRQVSIRPHYLLLVDRTFRTDLLFVRRLSAAGLLPIARMVQATDEDEPAAPVVGDDGDVHAGPEQSRRFPFDRSLLTRRVLVFDVFVEDYGAHRVMRQFGLQQEVPVPVRRAVPENVHS